MELERIRRTATRMRKHKTEDVPKKTAPINAEAVEMRQVLNLVQQLAQESSPASSYEKGVAQPPFSFEKSLSVFNKPLFDEKKFREYAQGLRLPTNSKVRAPLLPEGKFIMDALDEGKRRLEKGAQALNGLVATHRKLEQRIDLLEWRLQQIHKEASAFADSAIEELNDITKDARAHTLQIKRRNVQEVPVFSEPRRKKKKSEFMHTKPASSFLTGHSNFTLQAFMPPNIAAMGNTQTIPVVSAHKKRMQAIRE